MNEENYSPIGVGTKILETIEEAKNYNQWIASLFFPYLGEQNIEIGAGLGTISSLIMSNNHLNHQSVGLKLFDLSSSNQEHLRSRFDGHPKSANEWIQYYQLKNVCQFSLVQMRFLKNGL